MNYVIKNKKTKAKFGGWSVNPTTIFGIHQSRAKEGNHPNRDFQKAYDGSDPSDWVIEISSGVKVMPDNLTMLDKDGKPPVVEIDRSRPAYHKPTLEELILELGNKKDPATGRKYTIAGIASELNTTEAKVSQTRKDARAKRKDSK